MKFWSRPSSLFRKEKLDRDMAEEMRFHLAQRAADHMSDGMPPEEARYAAHRKFGNVTAMETHEDDGASGLLSLNFSKKRRLLLVDQ